MEIDDDARNTPTLLTFFIRLFVPESHKWEQERGEGNTSNWATIDLLGVLVGSLGQLSSSTFGRQGFFDVASFDRYSCRLDDRDCRLHLSIFRYLQRTESRQASDSNAMLWPTLRRMYLGAALSGVALLGTWSSAQWAPTWAAQLTQNQMNSREWTQIWLSFGALVGSFLIAGLGNWFTRRVTYSAMCLASLLAALRFFQTQSKFGNTFLALAFLLGVCTSSFYGFLPLYLPELFRTRVRATGQGFAYNFGRIIAAIGTLQMGALLRGLPKKQTWAGIQGGYAVACSHISAIYLIGLLIILFAPETHGKPLPE